MQHASSSTKQHPQAPGTAPTTSTHPTAQASPPSASMLAATQPAATTMLYYDGAVAQNQRGKCRNTGRNVHQHSQEQHHAHHCHQSPHCYQTSTHVFVRHDELSCVQSFVCGKPPMCWGAEAPEAAVLADCDDKLCKFFFAKKKGNG